MNLLLECYCHVSIVQASPSGGQRIDQPDETATSEGGIFEVPEGTPEELLDYVAKLSRHSPSLETNAEKLAYRRNCANAFLTTSTRFLDSGDSPASEEATQHMVVMRLFAIHELARLGDARGPKLLARFPGEMKKAGYGRMLRTAQARAIAARLFQVSVEEDPAAGLNEVIVDTKSLLASATEDLNDDEIWLAKVVCSCCGDYPAKLGYDAPQLVNKTLKELGDILVGLKTERAVELGKIVTVHGLWP